MNIKFRSENLLKIMDTVFLYLSRKKSKSYQILGKINPLFEIIKVQEIFRNIRLY
jgi:hypothetical protein